MDSKTGWLKGVAKIPRASRAFPSADTMGEAFHPALIPAAVFFLLAAALIIDWRIVGKYWPTGDEPHYMVIANSISRYHTLETTPAYRDMFNTSLLNLPGQTPDQHNTHAIAGPHGLFSEHNIGLPFLIAIPLRIAGVTGARLAMALIASGVAALAYVSTGLSVQDPRLRALLAVALSCAAPFVASAGQMYPDLPAGLLFGIALLTISRGALGQWYAPGRSLPHVLTAAAIAFAPWLQIKFAGASLLAAAGCVCWAAAPHRSLGARAAMFALPLAVSMALLAAYNRYAFGTMSGPYDSGALVANWHALMVFIGLHIDQFQGIFINDPMLLLAPIGAAALMRRKPAFGVFFVLLYASLVLPNAMHPNWYGGFSFAGRFVLTGAVLLLLPAAYGVRVLRLPAAGTAALSVVALCIQAAYYTKYQAKSFSLYNQQDVPFIKSYATLFGSSQHYLPEFCNTGWAFRYAPNYGWLAGIAVLLIIGWRQARPDHDPQQPRRTSPMAWGLAAACPLGGAAAAAVWQPPTTQTLVYVAAGLPGLTGHVQGSGRVATPGLDRADFLTFGPYVSLPKGRYRIELAYSSDGGAGAHVGDWAVVSNSGAKTLAAPSALPGTGGHSTTLATEINIGSTRDGIHIEVQTTFTGTAPLEVDAILIRKL